MATIALSVLFLGLAAPVLAEQDTDSVELALLDTEDQWQTNRRFKASASQLKREAEKSQVMIYNGLKDKTVDKALDTQFDRVENMVFVRIVTTDTRGVTLTDELGNAIIENDGCAED